MKTMDQLTRSEFLSKISTRELLDSRYAGYRPEYYADLEVCYEFSRLGKGGIVVRRGYTYDEVREELSKRPHIPNKNERRGLTKLRKKQGGR